MNEAPEAPPVIEPEVLEAERRRLEKAKTVNLTGTGTKFDPCKPCFGTGQTRGVRCDTCDGTGKVAAKSMDDALASLRTSVKVKRIADEQADLADRQQKVNALLTESRAPKRQLLKPQCELDFSGDWGRKLGMWKAKLNTGFLLALVGEWGNGKTQFAVELIRKNAEGLKASRFATATGFFMDIKATYKPTNPKDEASVIERYCEPSLLIIDEVAKRGETDWENNLLFHLINSRYEDKLDTVLIANQTKDSFDQSMRASIVRRLNETGGVIECDWKAFV
jgi:DNA replication protein DnaC